MDVREQSCRRRARQRRAHQPHRRGRGGDVHRREREVREPRGAAEFEPDVGLLRESSHAEHGDEKDGELDERPRDQPSDGDAVRAPSELARGVIYVAHRPRRLPVGPLRARDRRGHERARLGLAHRRGEEREAHRDRARADGDPPRQPGEIVRVRERARGVPDDVRDGVERKRAGGRGRRELPGRGLADARGVGGGLRDRRGRRVIGARTAEAEPSELRGAAGGEPARPRRRRTAQAARGARPEGRPAQHRVVAVPTVVRRRNRRRSF